VRFGTDLILKQRAKAYVNGEIFLEYICMVFLPNLNKLQSLEEFADEDPVLLMDNRSSHVGEEVLSLLRDAHVRIITWAPHAIHIFQELDLCLFGVLKRRGQYGLPFDDDHTTTNFLLMIYRTFRQTMIEPNS
jgi:2-methylisocitrate lyase-like PEP mutase family enzyme